MTILFVEGFDHQNDYTDLASGDDWSTCPASSVLSASYARFLGKGMLLASDGYLSKILSTNYSSLLIGFAYNSVTDDDSNPIAFRFSSGGSVGNEQVSVTVNQGAVNVIDVYKGNAGGTLLGSATVANTAGFWCYIEILATFNASTGSVTVRVNGNNVIALTNVDTDPNSTGNANTIAFGGSGLYLDDIYLIDPTTGSAPWNSFLGTVNGVTVETLFPSANQGAQDFSPSPDANANWQNVCETAMDGDTTYNYSPTNGDSDLFDIGSLSSNPVNIWAVATRAAARIDASTSVNLENRLVSNGTESDGSAVDLPSTYAYQSTIYETDPNTSDAWTETGVNAAQIGYVISSL